jgi:hypothetical protein
LLLVLVDEAVGDHLFLAQQIGKNVVAEVVLRVGIFGVGNQRLQQRFGIEDVDAHRSIHLGGTEGRAKARGSRLLEKALDFALGVHLDDAEARNFVGLNGQGGEGHFGL